MTEPVEILDTGASTTASPSDHFVLEWEEGLMFPAPEPFALDSTVSGSTRTYVVVSDRLRDPEPMVRVRGSRVATGVPVEGVRVTTPSPSVSSSADLGVSERTASRFTFFDSISRSAMRDPDELLAERTVRFYEKLGRPGIAETDASTEVPRLRAAEARTEQLYERIEQLLETSDKDDVEVQRALEELNQALQQESDALEPILMKRLPSVEATEQLSKRADELLAKYGEDPSR